MRRNNSNLKMIEGFMDSKCILMTLSSDGYSSTTSRANSIKNTIKHLRISNVMVFSRRNTIYIIKV